MIRIAENKITSEPINIQNSLDDAASSFFTAGIILFMFTKNNTNAAMGEISANIGWTRPASKRNRMEAPSAKSFLLRPPDDTIGGSQKKTYKNKYNCAFIPRSAKECTEVSPSIPLRVRKVE